MKSRLPFTRCLSRGGRMRTDLNERLETLSPERLHEMKRLSVTILAAVLILGLASVGALGQSIPAWAPGTAYSVGALVMFNSVEYKCIQAHTSQVGWEPPNVPALWGPVSGNAAPLPPLPRPAPPP